VRRIFRGDTHVLPQVVLIGHPFFSTGRAEHLRAIWRALRSADIRSAVYNLWPAHPPEIEDDKLRGALIEEIPVGSIRLFHCNGDEAAGAIAELERRQSGIIEKGYNIIYPAWELPSYPKIWGEALEAYDEVWTATAFVYNAIKPRVRVPVLHIPNACQPVIDQELTRNYFGLRAEAYIVLLFFDLWSYASRKNPWAAIASLKRVLQQRGGAALQLVIKINHGGHDGAALDALKQAAGELRETVLIDRTMSDNEIKNLIRCCDCLISLHRSEGFGRGPAEAMFLGKPVIATGWSGNMDYMNARVSFPISYRLIPVIRGEYLFEDGQVWAEPDASEAADVLVKLIDNPHRGTRMGRKAQRHMLKNFSDAVLGRRYRERFMEIASSRKLKA
jgi:glycosyltransferase involved in cell wall biosynthesis